MAWIRGRLGPADLIIGGRHLGSAGDSPARLTVELRDLIWDIGYAPIAALVGTTAERLNVLQFLTIRRYLTLVFAVLVLLLLMLAIWP